MEGNGISKALESSYKDQLKHKGVECKFRDEDEDDEQNEDDDEDEPEPAAKVPSKAAPSGGKQTAPHAEDDDSDPDAN